MYTPQDGCEIQFYEDAGSAGGTVIIKGSINDFAGTYFATHGQDPDLTEENNLRNRVMGGREINDHISSYQVKSGLWTLCLDSNRRTCRTTATNDLGNAQSDLAGVQWFQDAISSAYCGQ